MGKLKRVRKASTRPGEVEPVIERADGYMCSMCGKTYKRQKGNFPASQSTIFRANGAYMTICNHCLDSLFDHYKEALGSEEAAMKRMCMKLDIYWSPEIFKMINRASTSLSRVKSYISKTFLIKFVGKTYDDTLDEQETVFSAVEADEAVSAAQNEQEEEVEFSTSNAPVDPESVVFWGSGFTADVYRELNLRYDHWTKDVPKPLQKAEEALYKQVCLQEFQINRNAAKGESIERGQNVLNSLLSSLNVKPNQVAKEDDSKDVDGTPLGVWVRRWEENRPIPEYDEEDDGPSLVRYITVWFFGHLSKALGLRNVYSQVYEDEIAKYRVTKPEFEGEDDDFIISDLIGGDADDPQG